MRQCVGYNSRAPIGVRNPERHTTPKRWRRAGEETRARTWLEDGHLVTPRHSHIHVENNDSITGSGSVCDMIKDPATGTRTLSTA